MLSPEDAAALVLPSRLFDEEWYAGLVGRSFASRAEAVAHWVAQPGDDAPHPLFEPLWLYPRGWWRQHAPDPLSYYLSRAERKGRSPHPRYPQAELGPLEDWLVDHEPAELLAPVVARAAPGKVVVRPTSDDLGQLVRWARHLAASQPDATVDLTRLEGAAERTLASVAADLPSVHVGGTLPDRHGVTVTVDDGVAPPRWRWLEPLLAALDRPGVSGVQPVLVGDDRTITAPALLGHPVSSLDRLDGTELGERFPGVEARRADAGEAAEGVRVLTTASWLPGPRHAVPALDALLPTPTGLRWSIDIAAGASPIGRRWGDWHFARSLADALERLGQSVEIDHPETRGRATRAETDVVLVVRGLERVAPQPGAVNLLWVISHPEDVTPEELAGFDVAYAAGTAWAARHGVRPLLQCTDTTRFHPGAGEADPAGGALFVGNARGGPRPVVTAALAAGVPLRVVGSGWSEHGVEVAADRIANEDLPAAYATAGVVLNDHHDGMRSEGFVSNRVFDVLAVGGRLLTDEVPGLADAVGADVPTWRTDDDLARLARPPYDAWPGPDERRALAERIVAEHSFDARAATFLAAARAHLDSGG
ncbi:glycosyltransferase [Nocardioides sp.]|uniref:glycosyltransferase family protein n=1 Tax=Nocardioides sp. TaxID=35761 RepID=UPI0027205F60|nr:glycosyltransferase [Nocardioides sp.]MDO9457932.1 glycosyltransferase [Nocardioides sp.]